MAQLIPSLIPALPADMPPPETIQADPSSLDDIAIGGIGFEFSNTPLTPMVRETVPPEKARIDQAQSPGEQTLTNWWLKSQDSFHGGAGQLQLEPAFPTPFDHIRYDLSRNCDVWTPGRVSRLPDTAVLTTDTVVKVVGVVNGGVDAVAYLTSAGAVKLITDPAGAATAATFSGVSSIKDIVSDGTSIYAASTTIIYKLTPASVASAPTVATLAATAASGPVLGWSKSRLMLGVNGQIYEVDVSTTGTTLSSTQLKYTHPSAGFVWRCFGSSPTAVLAAGDAGGESTLMQFTVVSVSGAPVLQANGDIATMPVGERILSLANSQGTFLALGTTKGVRVGTFDTYFGSLTLGPVALLPTDPVIPAVALAQRDRFIFAAGLAYDEGGLIRLDLGSKITDAGRFAWAPDLICPVTTPTAATSVATLPVSGSLVFSVPGTGVLLEGVGAGVGRESWLRTSRIRFGTTEPKLFKLGRVRGDLSSGEINVKVTTPSTTDNVITVGFTTTDPDEFRLPPGLAEWQQLTLTILGDGTSFTSYQVKALPGTRRQRHFQFVLALADSSTTKTGQRRRDPLSSRAKLAALEAMDAAGDEVILQEFTPTGVISTRVVIEELSFKQVGRPTRRSDIGGDVTVLLRSVES